MEKELNFKEWLVETEPEDPSLNGLIRSGTWKPPDLSKPPKIFRKKKELPKLSSIRR